MSEETIGQIIAAVVAGLLGIVGTFLFYYFKNRQGNRIIVKRVSETPQIRISEEVRKNLKITYNDQPVDNLVLNTLVIYNNGIEIIKPVDFRLGVTTSAGELAYLESETDDPLDEIEVVRGGPGFVIKRPYLNPKKKFKEEEIKLAVFSNTRLKFSVEGGGEGWYSRFEDLNYARVKQFVYILAATFFIFFLSFVNIVFISGEKPSIVQMITLFILVFFLITTIASLIKEVVSELTDLQKVFRGN